MVVIKYPEPAFRVKKEGEKQIIFDSQRKKWVPLTAEEWVRQNFVQYLLEVKGFSSSLIAVEKEIKLGELRKRFDVLVYDNNHKPWMMVECKAAEIKLNTGVLEQLLRYNISVPVEYLVITNGNETYAWQRKEQKLEMINDIPAASR